MGTYRVWYVLGFLWLSCYCQLARAQDSLLLAYDDFMAFVLKEHPLTKRADLTLDYARAQLLSARGGFDPKLESNWDEKYFDDKHYFRNFKAGVKVPSWWGLSFKAEYENNEGQFLNRQNTTSEFGLWTVGVEANVLQGLLIDERRTALKQAQIYQNASQAERDVMVSRLVLEASEAYVQWQAYVTIGEVINQSIELANIYFEATKQSYENGEYAAIDTLEALLIVQDRQLLQRENDAEIIKYRQKVATYLWMDEAPLELANNTFPEKLEPGDYTIQTMEVFAGHPEIQEKLFKQSIYEVEERMKREKLKPKLMLAYNPLLATNESLRPSYTTSDYKWGVSFSYPLLTRKERGDLEKTRVKLNQIALEIEDKRNQLSNKLRSMILVNLQMQEQINLAEANNAGYLALLEAEQERLFYGESSVFLLNKRQEKYVDGNIKVIKLYSKARLNQLKAAYYAGDLLRQLEN